MISSAAMESGESFMRTTAMKQVAVMMVALVVALSGTARADEAAPPPERARPFLTEDDDSVVTVTGAFGPARDTMLVFSYRGLMGAGKFVGFALVPDDKARHGQRKLEISPLPQSSEDGQVAVMLVANLDKDADDEIVVAFHVFRTVRGREGGYSYSTWEYAVLDWNGKKFVRRPALEKKLQAKAESREVQSTLLSEDEARAALGVAKK